MVKEVFQYCSYLVLFTASLFVSLLPRRAMVALGRGIGSAAYTVWGGRRRISLDNLAHAFGDTKTQAELEEIARESFRTIGLTLMELFWCRHRMNEELCAKLVDIEGLEIAREAVSRGKGVLIVPAHYGNWEIMASATGYEGLDLTFLAKRLKNPRFDDFVNAQRCRSGNKVIYMNGGAKKLEAALKDGKSIATLLDQKVPVRRGGILVDFFGRPAPTTPLVAELHLATGAPLIHMRGYPLKDGRCRFVLGPETTFTPTGNHEEDVKNLTQELVSFMESYIREDPEFWIWGHKRWKLDKASAPPE